MSRSAQREVIPLSKPFRRLLLTGAAGGLGRVLRPHLREWCEHLRVSDRVDCGPTHRGEEVVVAEAAPPDAPGADQRFQGGPWVLAGPIEES